MVAAAASPPSCFTGPRVMGNAAHGDAARATQLLSPLTATAAAGTSHPRALGELGKHGCYWGHPVPIASLGARHLPDAGVPPGRAPAAWQHLPAPAVPPAAPVPAAWPSPAAAVLARHHVMPSRSPLFSCLCFASPMVPGTQSCIVAPPAPRVMPASVPGPVPPPLTLLPPQGTAPIPWGGQGGHEPLLWGSCRIKAPRFGDGLSALITAEQCRMAGGAGGRYK